MLYGSDAASGGRCRRRGACIRGRGAGIRGCPISLAAFDEPPAPLWDHAASRFRRWSRLLSGGLRGKADVDHVVGLASGYPALLRHRGAFPFEANFVGTRRPAPVSYTHLTLPTK